MNLITFHRAALLWMSASTGALAVPAWAIKPATATAGTTEQMLVVASRLPSERDTSGRSVTTLERSDIQQLGHEYAADLFRFIPGVAVNRSGGFGGQTRLFIRGAEGNHTVILVDGIDVSQAGTGEFDVASLLSADIERIEVLRGPQSGLYGSNAIGGVINVHTRQPLTGFSVSTQLEAGEHDVRQGAVSFSGGNELARGRLNYVQRRSEFDVSSNGTEGDEDRNRTVSGQLHIRVSDRLFFDLQGRQARKDTETDGFDFSGGPLQGLPFDDDSFNNTEDLTLGGVATLSLVDGRWINRLHIAGTETELDAGGFGNESERSEVRLDTTWQWRGSNALRQRTTLFAHIEEESFKNLYPIDPSQVPTLERDMLGYGVEHRMEMNDNVYVNLNLREDDNDDFEDATTFALDLSYRFADGVTRLHGSYGRAVTNPTFFEQFGFIPGTFVGNPDLQPERSAGWDAGVERSMFDGALVVDIAYFEADLEDEIQDRFPSVANISGESDRKGMEMRAAWQPRRGTTMVLNYTYTDADEPGGAEVRRPQHMASLSFGQRLLNDKAHMALNIVYTDELLDNDFRNFFTNGFAPQRTALDSYTVVGLNARYQLTPDLQVYARLENLLDEGYAEVIGYATPGRSLYAGIRYRYGG